MSLSNESWLPPPKPAQALLAARGTPSWSPAALAEPQGLTATLRPHQLVGTSHHWVGSHGAPGATRHG